MFVTFHCEKFTIKIFKGERLSVMFKFTFKHPGMAVILLLSLIIAGCGSGGDNGTNEENGTDGNNAAEETKEIELVYVEWDSEIASTNVIAEVLRQQGYEVKVTPLDNTFMWQSIANGDADAMVAAWLPGTHGDLYEEYKDDLVDLGKNLEGAKIGLVVPSYMNIDSIADLKDSEYADAMNQKITGIEEGSGVVKASQEAVDVYGLDGWEVQTSSSGAMATVLGEAIEDEKPIVVTGWTPHWKFAKYDLKYLEDPEGVFGEEEYIATMVRKGLEEDMPEAYQILDQFNWTASDMESVMLEIQNGTSPEDAAKAWIENNQEKVQEWLEGVE